MYRARCPVMHDDVGATQDSDKAAGLVDQGEA